MASGNVNIKWLNNIILLSFFLFLDNQITIAQNLKKGFKLIYRNEISDASSIFIKSYLKNNNCPVSNYGLAFINGFHTDNPDHFLSYQYILAALKYSPELSRDRKYKKLKKYITSDTIALRFRQIDSMLLAVILRSGSLTIINRHLAECRESAFNPYLILLRDSLVFTETVKVNTIEAYDEFLKTFPSAIQVKQALRNRNHLYFIEAKRKNTILAFKQFIKDFPEAEDIPEAKALSSELAFQEAVKTNTVLGYERFIEDYPYAGEKLTNAAKENIRLIYLNKANTGNLLEIKKYISLYPESPETITLKNKLIEDEFKIAIRKSTKDALNNFIKSNPEMPEYFLQAADSALNKIENLSKYFPDETIDKIAFIRDNNLWLMNENGTDQQQITNTGKVISLACNKANIFYGELNERDLDIYSYHVDDDNNKNTRKIASIKGQKNSDFITLGPLYGGSMEWINNNTLEVKANFRYAYEWGFDIHAVNIITGKVLSPSEYNSNQPPPTLINELKFIETNNKSYPFSSRKIGKSVALFYINKQNKAVKLLNTQSLNIVHSPYDIEEIGYHVFKINSNKVLAYINEDNGVILILVNLDGSGQLILKKNFIPDLEKIRKLNSNQEPALIEMNENTGINQLVAYLGPKNERHIIADNVDFFVLVPR
jgi:hypothetical protein